MFYGNYKEARDGAWRCLLQFQIDRLPVDVLQIARAAQIRVIRNSVIHDLLPGETGKTYYDGRIWVIIYDDTRATEFSRVTVAHELGHVFLGHELKHARYRSVNEIHNRATSERQADLFACRLLCPACVLWGMGLQQERDIARYCRVPLSVAAERSQRMRELYGRKRFLTSPTEQEVYRLFSDYIRAFRADST